MTAQASPSLEVSDGFSVGAEVFLVRFAYGSSPQRYERVMIEKVYKNGNIVVGGQQYSGRGDTRHSTARGYSAPRLTLITPQTISLAEAADRYYTVEAIIRRFERLSPAKLSYDKAIRLAAILDEEDATPAQANGVSGTHVPTNQEQSS